MDKFEKIRPNGSYLEMETSLAAIFDGDSDIVL